MGNSEDKLKLNKQKVFRINWNFTEKVSIPGSFKDYLWEYKDFAPLEILIKRVLQYGNFEEIKEIFELYPDETFQIALKYPDIRRGVKFWIKKWKGSTI